MTESNQQPASRPRVLYIAPDIVLDLPRALSRYYTGDYVTVWNKGRDADAATDRAVVESSFGDFRFRPMLPSRLPPGLRQLHEFWFFVRSGLQAAREHGPFDAIICYSPYRPALAALLLRRLLGTPVVVEFPQDPTRVYQFVGGRFARLKHAISPRIARWVAGQADQVVVLHPGQTRALGLEPSRRVSVVHPFTRLSLVPPDGAKEKSIVFLGHPPHLKGVDLLLTAFRALSDEFPDYTLKLAGSHTLPADIAAAASHPRIQVLGRLPHGDALRLVASAGIFVLASRTEVVPRVIIEAMAAGACVVASDVGGIPYLVQHEVNGLIFASGDAKGLETQLRRVLADERLARRLGEAGQQRVRAEFSEAVVAEKWHDAVALARGNGAK